MKDQKAHFVFPSHDKSTMIMRRSSQPYNLLRLATYAREKIPSLEVRIHNEEITSKERIVQNFNIGEWVFISSNTLTYPNALYFAKEAKKKDCKVCLGGIHVTYLPREVLQNRPYVDYVGIGMGEKIIYNLLIGKKPEEIPGLAFKHNNEIIVNPPQSPQSISLDRFPIADRNLVDMQRYFQYFQEDVDYIPAKKLALTFWQNYCKWKEETWDEEKQEGGCNYCCLQNYRWNVMSPKKAVEELEYLVKEFEVDYVYDGSDSITGNTKWLEEFSKKKPREINPFLAIHVRADEINEKTARLLRNLNVYHVAMGIESFSNKCQKSFRRGISRNQLFKAAELLGKYGIGILASMIEMAPGETRKDAEDNYKYAKEFYERFGKGWFGCATLLPVPGSKYYKMLLEKEPKYKREDLLNLSGMQRDFAKHFCPEPFAFYEAISSKIHTIAPVNRRGSFSDGAKNEIY